MQVFEVKVRGTIDRFYEVKARNAREAELIWQSGDMTGEDAYDFTPVSVQEAFEDDGVEYDVEFEDGDDDYL